MGKFISLFRLIYGWSIILVFYSVLCIGLAWFMIDGKDYIKFIKSHYCMICGKSPVDSDHLEHIGMGGNRKLNSIKDFSCVPLCRQHHTERHNLGFYQFEHKHSVNLWKEAFHLLRKYFTK